MRKENVAKVMEVCKEIGVDLEPKEAQWLVNKFIDFMVALMRKELKHARSIYAIGLWLIKTLLAGWERLHASDRYYDELKKHRDWVTDKRADQQAMQSLGQILKKMGYKRTQRQRADEVEL